MKTGGTFGNDKGRVLYENGTWCGGTWTPLVAPSQLNYAGYPQTAFGVSINDNDVIFGNSSQQVGPLAIEFASVRCFWNTPAAAPQLVKSNNNLGSGYAGWLSSSLAFHGDTYQLQLSNDGRFTAETYWTEDDHQDMRTGYWKLPDATHPMASEIPGSFGVDWSQGPDMKWGKDVNASKGVIYAPGRLPDLTIIPFNVATIQGTVLAMPSANSTASAQVFVKGTWKPSSAYANAIDISSGGIAIGRNHDGLTAPTHMNGKWTGIERTAPGVPSAWKDQTVILLDTTPGGWILAGRGNTVPQLEHAVMLPIKVDGVDPDYVPPTLAPNTPAPEPPEYLAGGVDRISMMAEGGSGRVAEMWIMAPNGGASNTVRIRSPVSDTCSLTLASNPDVSFTPEILNQKDTQVQVSGKSTDSVDDSVTLKLGGTLNSLSAPIKIKAMKKRIVNVALHKVIGLDANGAPTPPAYMPIPADLKAYLDKIYGPQVNVTFNVTPFDETGPAGGIDFDLNNDNKLTGDSGNSERDAATPNAKAGIVSLYINIDVWVIGGSVSLMYMNGYLEERAYGNRFHGNKILVDGDMTGLTSKFVGKEMDHVLHTIAHEIGHVMTRDNHPGEELNKSTLGRPQNQMMDFDASE